MPFEATSSGCAIILPVDGVVAREFKAGAANETVAIDQVPADGMILDVGPKTVEAVNVWIDRARTLVWNGPLGAFEIQPFDKATVAAARHAAKRTRAGELVSVAGGGDTVAAVNQAGPPPLPFPPPPPRPVRHRLHQPGNLRGALPVPCSSSPI